MPIEIESDPTARPTVPLVVANGLVLDADLGTAALPEVEDVAAELARAIERAAERSGARPRAVAVRHEELAAALVPRLGVSGIEVRWRATLRELEPAARELIRRFGGHGGLGRVSMSRTWAGWGLPAREIARFHEAAAAFHRAAPWTCLTNLDLLAISTRAGRSWIGGVMGNDRQQFGLALYSRREDFELLAAGDTLDFERRLRGRTISLTFDRGGDLPKALRREVARAGWELAGPDAYPVLIVMNSVGGGLAAADASDLIAALEAVPRYLTAEVAGGEAWLDAASGLRIEERRHGFGSGSSASPPIDLRPGGASGWGADPEAAIRALPAAAADPDAFLDREIEVVERFAAALAAEGMSRASVAKHAARARILVEFLAMHRGVPLAGIHELDLRSFLHDWYPRKVVTSDADARAMPGSLGRFFAYLAAREGIALPCAREILADKKLYAARRESFPGGFFWDPAVVDWIQELTLDLDARLLLPDGGLAGGEEWGDTMGETEARLHDELVRRWLAWRDELLSSAPRSLGRLRARLVTRQRDWEEAPHPALGGRSPREAVLAEREAP